MIISNNFVHSSIIIATNGTRFPIASATFSQSRGFISIIFGVKFQIYFDLEIFQLFKVNKRVKISMLIKYAHLFVMIIHKLFLALQKGKMFCIEMLKHQSVFKKWFRLVNIILNSSGLPAVINNVIYQI